MERYTPQRIEIVKIHYKNGEKKIMSDETHFPLGGYVNKQNCAFGARKTQK